MTVRSGLGNGRFLPITTALNPEHGFLHDGALTVAIDMSLLATVLPKACQWSNV